MTNLWDETIDILKEHDNFVLNFNFPRLFIKWIDSTESVSVSSLCFALLVDNIIIQFVDSNHTLNSWLYAIHPIDKQSWKVKVENKVIVWK
ncbi:UNVERIFIED_CONTAM: hypothetical protein NY603_17870 [Bacteroidetes bacterium 56_B9]